MVVELDDEVQLFAEEVEIVAAEGTLAAKLQAKEAAVSEKLPEEGFERGWPEKLAMSEEVRVRVDELWPREAVPAKL